MLDHSVSQSSENSHSRTQTVGEGDVLMSKDKWV